MIFLTVLTLSQQGGKKTKKKNALKSQRKKKAQLSSICTLIVLTRLAVLFATSLADCTKCLLATGFAVFEEAMRQALHRADVCLATIVAADKTCKNQHRTGTMSEGRKRNQLQLCNISVQSQATESNQNAFDCTQTKQSPVSWQGWAPCHHLWWAARWIDQVLARHLDCLVGTGKLNWVNEALLTSLAVWIWDTDQVSSLEMGKRRKQS